MPESSKIPASPADKERQLAMAKYMLFRLGFSQKRVAYELKVSKDTVCRWVLQNGWRGKLKLARKKSGGTQYQDSLSAFIIFIRINNKSMYANIEPVYNHFLKTL